MPLVSSSMMVKEADLTGRASESPATSSEPRRVTVSSSSSMSSFTGLGSQRSGTAGLTGGDHYVEGLDFPEGALVVLYLQGFEVVKAGSVSGAGVGVKLDPHRGVHVPRVCRVQGGVGSVSRPVYPGE